MKIVPIDIKTHARYIDYQGKRILDENGEPITGERRSGGTTFRLVNGYLDSSSQPAIECIDTHVEYWKEGFLHKQDGPAVISNYSQIEEFWINGERFQELV